MFDELLIASEAALDKVDTYLPLPENQLGRAVLTRLHATGQTALFGSMTRIHGHPGVGKTHLALWTLKELRRRNSRLKFAYASTRQLCQCLSLADSRQSLADFLEKCRQLDVVICEDLDWLTAVPAAQADFMQLTEALEESLTRILVTSRKPIGELRPMDQRLISRCHGGLCVSLPMVGFESRVQLLLHWFQEFKLPILKPVLASASFLAEKLPGSPRELYQAISKLAELQKKVRSPIDIDYLEQWLAADSKAPRLSFDAIVHKVAQEFGVDPSELRSRSRQLGLAVPRQCAMWLARELTGKPLDQIGQYFDRSHTTVSHSLTRIRDLLPKAPTLRHQVHKLRQQLKDLPREDCA
jgi:chromosomal replication initiator protein